LLGVEPTPSQGTGLQVSDFFADGLWMWDKT